MPPPSGAPPQQPDGRPNGRISWAERVDRIKGSNLSQPQGTEDLEGRTPPSLFIFDPRSTAIVLVGGDKSGRWDEWYAEAIPAAEALYDEYLDELRNDGL